MRTKYYYKIILKYMSIYFILFLVIENIINIETENSTALEPGSVNSLLHPGPIRSTYILVSYLQNLHYQREANFEYIMNRKKFSYKISCNQSYSIYFYWW